MNDDVLIVGSLKDEELRKSIDSLVDYVGNKTNEMAQNFNGGLNSMKLAMKDFAVTQKVSVDLMKQAWREMSTSFDAMVAAQSAATSGGSGSSGGGKPTYADDTIGALKQEIAALQKERDELKLNSDELREQNRIIDERQRKLKEQTTNLATLRLDRTMRMPSNDLEAATKKLRALEIMQRRYKDSTELSEKQQKRLTDAIDSTKKAIDRLTSAKPKTLKEVIGMDESTVDAVARKMRALRTVTVNPNNKNEIRALGNEYQRLSRLQADLLGKGIQLTHSNNYLAQSFGYIRNRIVYALTLGAVTSFTKQVYEIRGQYELLERSLGILIDDMRKGSEMFNELNQMALKSPFTLMELATGAKQLLAYNFAEEEVVDTTRRLADISAALGVPMERLVYNLGQIKAQTALTARDARDFANAGLAIVPMLAQMYTEEKRFGDEMVTTAQVFDMMSKKMVTYSDVIKVINKVTDEGGKFYDFQAKQAETLRVKMANLTLAWNNMLNEIGSENQKALTLPVTALKALFENWKAVYDIVRDLVILYGVYRARAILISIVNGTLISQGVISGMFQLGRAVSFVANAWKILSVAVASNPIGAIATAVAAGAVAMGLFNDNVSKAVEYQERFGRAGAKTVSDLETYFTSLENISKESSNYKKVMSELNSILGEYDMQLVTENDTQEQINEKRRISIQLIKEEILERKHLNEVEQGRSEYETKVEDVRKRLRESLGDAITENFLGIGTINKEIAENAPAIANIVADVIERNIDAIAGKTGDEYQKGVDKIFDEIGKRMEAIGLSESTRNKAWLENTLFRSFTDSNIIKNAINDIANAKNELDNYTEALDKAYEAEKKAAVDGANFNDRVEQTQRRLMDAAYDTDNFAKKVKQLLKDYGGQNVIDFLVKVKTEVPAWMSQKGLTELTQLSARFAALATQAKKAGKESLNVNGKDFSVQQLFERAAQYAQAAQNKQADIESRKSTTITREASEALKEYKSALDAVNVAKNRQKQGTADQALVTEKEAEAQKAYNKALEKGVSLDELLKAKNGRGGSKKDILGDALAKEVQLISDMQKLYKEYQKVGVDAYTARIASAKEYEKTLQSINTQLKKFGITGISGEELANMDARNLREYYTQLRNIANAKGNTKGVEALEKAIRALNTEITKVDYKTISDSLNNELGRIKGEYELAVELDANPELGGIFADMFGIDNAQLIHTIDEFMRGVQNAFDVAVRDMGYGNNINLDVFAATKDSWRIWAMNVGLSEEQLDEFSKKFKTAQDLAKKWAEDVVKQTKSLQYSLADTNGKIAIKEKELADLRTSFNNETNEKQKELLRLQIQEQENAIAELRAGLLQEIPEYAALFNSIVERSDYMTRRLVANLKKIYDAAKARGTDAKGNYTITGADGTTTLIGKKQFEKEYEKLTREERKSQAPFKKIKEAFSKDSSTSLVDWAKGMELVGGELQKVQGIVSNFGNIAEALGADPATVETINDIATSIGGVATAAQGMAQIASGDYIGGAASMLSGIFTAVSTWYDNSDKKITAAIKDSELAVKKLENQYKKLQAAVEDAYGTMAYAAEKAAISNQKLQLEEMRRQLRLEQSRESKNRDDDKIESLKGQIIDLEREIQKATDNWINDMLGISSVGDAAEQLVASMIDAFRQGDDYMGKFYDSFEEMIENMIMKAIASKVIGEYIETMWDNIKSRAEARSQQESQELENAQREYDEYKNSYDYAIEHENTLRALFGDEYYENWIRELEKDLERAEAQKNQALKNYEKAIMPTPSDVAGMRADAKGMSGVIKEWFDATMEEWGITFGDKSGKNLSNLQQGIQGITEDTASALEGYMNGISQQVYLQSEYLRQIVEFINIDADPMDDVKVASLSQILLQLQTNYTLMQTIDTRMENWSTATGNGIRVELLS